MRVCDYVCVLCKVNINPSSPYLYSQRQFRTFPNAYKDYVPSYEGYLILSYSPPTTSYLIFPQCERKDVSIYVSTDNEENAGVDSIFLDAKTTFTFVLTQMKISHLAK